MVGFCDEEMPDEDCIEAGEHLPVEVEVSRPSAPTRSVAPLARVSSRNSVALPRKRKAVNQAPTPQKSSSGSSTRSFTVADVAASEGKRTHSAWFTGFCQGFGISSAASMSKASRRLGRLGGVTSTAWRNGRRGSPECRGILMIPTWRFVFYLARRSARQP